MSLTRQTQKVFGSNANANQLAVFGSMKTGTPVYSTNLSTLQSTAYTQGWSEALLNDKAPYMEEMNAVQYGLSYQIAYMLQEGAFAYDANTNYSSTSIVKAFENGKMYFYHSLIDNNQGHALSDSTYWEKISISDTRNIGEIVQSAIPLTDAGLHLLDGALLSGSGSYGAFVSYIAGLYTADPTANYFTTEADWQTSVSTYGVCGKFVYDSVNNTVRLPKVTGFVEGTIDVTALGDLVEAGLPDHNHTTTAFYWGSQGSEAEEHAQPPNFGSNISLTSSNASSSNPIYGNSNTVQPQAIKGFMYIVVATSTKTDIQVDIDEIATDLNGKADVDLSNTTPSQTFIDSSIGWNAPDFDNAIAVTGVTTYTMPSDGWLISSGYNTYLARIYINDVLVAYGDYATNGTWTGNLNCQIQVSKGDIATGIPTGDNVKTYFIPSKGVN